MLKFTTTAYEGFTVACVFLEATFPSVAPFHNKKHSKNKHSTNIYRYITVVVPWQVKNHVVQVFVIFSL